MIFYFQKENSLFNLIFKTTIYSVWPVSQYRNICVVKTNSLILGHDCFICMYIKLPKKIKTYRWVFSTSAKNYTNGWNFKINRMKSDLQKSRGKSSPHHHGGFIMWLKFVLKQTKLTWGRVWHRRRRRWLLTLIK